jgi:CSLREA domain-containing protein
MRYLKGQRSSSNQISRFSTVEPLEGRRLLSAVVVNTTADTTDAAGSKTVSLRDAIAVANAATTATTITFDATVFKTAETITLGGSAMTISNAKEPVTITGPSAGLTISGNKKSQAFVVEDGATASLSDLTITGCVVTTPNAANGLATGGAILVVTSSTLTLSDSTVTGNTAASYGGGIDGNYGTLNLVGDTITNNTANAGGGGGVSSGADVTIEDCTIAGNVTAGSGGGVYGSGADLKIANSIVAGNKATQTGPDLFDSANTPFDSLGYNLIGNVGTTTGWTTHDQTGTTAKPLAADLGTLASNGGPTQTILPLTGSPAIDKGSNALIPAGTTTDQRGLPRTYNGTVDIGAVETQPFVQITSPGNQTATVAVSKSVTLGSFVQYSNATPFKDTVTWGDGSATTALSLTAAGTIPATAHTFAKTGTFTVTEVITDAKANTSNTVTFTVTVVAPVGSISGTVFDDFNDNGKKDAHELGLGLWTVYLDTNDDGKLDTGDVSATTDVNGNFTFANLAAGTYYLRVVPVTGDTTTTPAGGLIKIVLTAGQLSTGNLFGEF